MYSFTPRPSPGNRTSTSTPAVFGSSLAATHTHTALLVSPEDQTLLCAEFWVLSQTSSSSQRQTCCWVWLPRFTWSQVFLISGVTTWFIPCCMVFFTQFVTRILFYALSSHNQCYFVLGLFPLGRVGRLRIWLSPLVMSLVCLLLP